MNNCLSRSWRHCGIAILSLAGCAPDGPLRGDVRGRVTIAGNPVEQGAIIFTPVEGVAGAPVQFPIKNGTYASAGKGAVVGKNGITISGAEKTGKKSLNMVTGDMDDVYVEIVPARYNEKSALSVDVVEGENTFDFDLEGKSKR